MFFVFDFLGAGASQNPQNTTAFEAADTNQKHRRAEEFMDTPQCCLDSWFSEFLRASVGTVEDLVQPEMRLLFQRVGYQFAKTTNMHLEGLLSEIKSAVPVGKRAANAEKEAFLSHLKMLTKSHVQRGRPDPRTPVRRSALIDLGVPMEHAHGPTWTRRDVRWRNVRLSQWKASVGDVEGHIADETRRLSELWANMSSEERDASCAELGLDEPGSCG